MLFKVRPHLQTHEAGRCDSCGEARSGNTRSRKKNNDKVVKGYAKFGDLFILAKAYPSSKCFWYPKPTYR